MSWTDPNHCTNTTQHSTQPQHRHMPEAIQMQPRHIRTNASQISWKHKWDTQKRCAPQTHIQPWQSFSHAFWYLTFYYWHTLSCSIWRINILTYCLAFLSDILSFRRFIWHLIWHLTLYLTYILTFYPAFYSTDIFSDAVSGIAPDKLIYLYIALNLTFIPTFCPPFVLAFYLASCLTFYR